MDKTQRDLPNATTILILGILSLLFCWCYGILGLILGIVALVLSGSQRRLYTDFPGEYSEASYKNVNTGRTCAIIGICISIIVFLFFILIFLGIIFTTVGHTLLRTI